jgi:hypothetical protein
MNLGAFRQGCAKIFFSILTSERAVFPLKLLREPKARNLP